MKKNDYNTIEKKHIYFQYLLLFILIVSFNFEIKAQFECGQAEAMNAWFQKHPEKKKQFDDLQMQKNNIVNSKKQTTSIPSYTIPLVFHIIHLNGPENISDAQVIDQVAILNRDYQKQNADTISVIPTFTNNIANVGFSFKLATIDPNGNCTNGIVRHYSSKTNWDVNNLNDFIYSWPTNQYLNIYVVKSMNINATAYTFLPGSGVPNFCDAIVTMHNMVGSFGTSQPAYSRVLTHEVAHWFDVPHIWGVSNQPGVVCGDDGISDTPITKGFSTCNTTTSNVCNIGIYENAQNYMDYSPCKIMFTNGQAARMISTINSTIQGRDNISSSTNLLLTGVSGTIACNTLADFYVNKNINCATNSFTFTSLSQFGSTSGSSLLWSFPGGVPSSSTNSVEVVTYTNPGVYPVTLTATGLNGVDTETKNGYITIYNSVGNTNLPSDFDFEGTSLPNNINIINEQLDTVTWKLNSTLGANVTNKCIYINNFPDSTNYGNRDVFETPFYDFSNTTNVGLSYYYAYAKRYTSQADSFKVQYSLDCGGSWTNIIGIPSINTMAVNSGGTLSAAFIPTPAQWKQVNISPSLLFVLNNKPSVKFRFFFKNDYYVNGSNNIYIDQINLSGTVGLNEFENSLELQLYPNPTNAATNIEYKTPLNSTTNILVYDITGRLVENSGLINNTNELCKYTINKNAHLKSGLYFINLTVNNKTITKKLVIN